jgi:hypothetical protein
MTACVPATAVSRRDSQQEERGDGVKVGLPPGPSARVHVLVRAARTLSPDPDASRKALVGEDE